MPTPILTWEYSKASGTIDSYFTGGHWVILEEKRIRVVCREHGKTPAEGPKTVFEKKCKTVCEAMEIAEAEHIRRKG